MHDRRQEISARLQRVLEERIRPAVHTTLAPLDVSVWHVPPAADGLVGDPVSFAVARDATYDAGQVGDRWGPAWGTTWFRLTATCPRARGRSRRVVDLGWTAASRGSRPRRSSTTPTGAR